MVAGAGSGAGPTDCNGTASVTGFYATAIPMTFATTGTFQIFSVKVFNQAGVSSEVVTQMWSEVTGATGTNKQLTQFQYFGLLGKPGEKLICRILNTGASSAYFMQAYGVQKAIQ